MVLGLGGFFSCVTEISLHGSSRDPFCFLS